MTPIRYCLYCGNLLFFKSPWANGKKYCNEKCCQSDYRIKHGAKPKRLEQTPHGKPKDWRPFTTVIEGKRRTEMGRVPRVKPPKTFGWLYGQKDGGGRG